MAIYRKLRDSAFGPEDIYRIVFAYESALMVLGLKRHDDPLTEMLANFIIEVAETGEKDPEMICALALRRLNETDRADS